MGKKKRENKRREHHAGYRCTEGLPWKHTSLYLLGSEMDEKEPQVYNRGWLMKYYTLTLDNDRIPLPSAYILTFPDKRVHSRRGDRNESHLEFKCDGVIVNKQQQQK